VQNDPSSFTSRAPVFVSWCQAATCQAAGGMRGELFVYCPVTRLVAFQSSVGASSSGAGDGGAPCCATPDVLVFIGGLTDGFHATPYVERLADALATAGWSLCQARRQRHLRSSAWPAACLLTHVRRRCC
jgi:hypothetical protein